MRKSILICFSVAIIVSSMMGQIIIRDPMTNPGSGDTGDLSLGTVIKMVETNTIDACGATESPVGIITSRYEQTSAPDQYLISASGITTVLISPTMPGGETIHHGDKVVTAENGRVTRIDLNPEGYIVGTALNYGGPGDELKILINIHTGGGGGDPDDVNVTVTSHDDFNLFGEEVTDVHMALDVLDQEIFDIYGGALSVGLNDAYLDGSEIAIDATTGPVLISVPSEVTGNNALEIRQTDNSSLALMASNETGTAIEAVSNGTALYSNGDFQMKSDAKIYSNLGFQFHLDDAGGGSVEYFQVMDEADAEIFRIQENRDVKVPLDGDYVIGFSGEDAWSLSSLAEVVGAQEHPTLGSIYHLPSGWTGHNMINPDSSLVWNIAVIDSAIGDPATIMHGLQDGYDDGNQIETDGDPVVIKSPSSALLDVGDTTTVLLIEGHQYIDGTLEVTGDIQTSGNGLYMVNATGDTMHLSVPSLDGDYDITFPNADGTVLLDGGGGSLPTATADGTVLHWDVDAPGGAAWVANDNAIISDDGSISIKETGASTNYSTFASSALTASRTYSLPDANGEVSVLGQTITSDEIEDGTIATDDIGDDQVTIAKLAAEGTAGQVIKMVSGSPAWADEDPSTDNQNLSLEDRTLSIDRGTGVTFTGWDIDDSDDITTATTAGGDLSGTYPDPSVIALQGNTVSSTAPTADQILKWNSVSSEWQPADDIAGTDDQNLNEVLSEGNSTGGLAITDGTDSQVDIDGTLLVGGNGIYGNTTGDAALSIYSNGNIRMDLDEDSDGSADFAIRNGANGLVFSVTEGGNVDADGNGDFNGNLTLSGDSRTLSSGNSLDITGNSGIDIIIDVDGSGTSSEFNIKHDATGDEIFTIRENGNAQIYGELQDATGDGGAAGDVLTSTGPSGNIEWIDPSTLGSDDQTLSYNTTTDEISIEDGNTIDISEVDTDDQNLSLAGPLLNITDGTGVDLSGFMDDTDDQTLTYNAASDEITIEDGNTIDISEVDTDDQNLSLSGTTLNITDGTGADLSSFMDDTDDQDLSLLGTNLSITDGSGVDLSGLMDNTDDQILSYNATTDEISIEDGNTIDISEVNSDNQDLSLAGTTLNITGGTGADLSGLMDNTDDQNITGSSFNTITNELTIGIEDGASQIIDLSDLDNPSTDDQNISGSGLSGTTLTIGIEDGSSETVDLASLVNDADAVIGNEFQDLSSSRSGSDVTIAITDGTNATFTDQVNDADADATNEYNTNLNLSGTTLQLTDGGGTLTQDLSSLADGTGTDDQNISGSSFNAVSNQLTIGIEDGSSETVDLSALDDNGTDDQNISGSGLSGTTLTIGIENGTNETVNLASLVNDADSVIGNEFQDLSSSRSGSDVTIAITDGTNATFTDNVNDADADATNEIQSLSISGHDITLSDGGGTVTVPDNVDDADADATNEIQDIFASITDGSNTYNASSSSDDIRFAGSGGASVTVNSTTGQVTIDASGVSSTVSTSAPVTGNGSAGSPITMAAATNSVNGYLTSADHTHFSEAYGWGDHSMAGYLTSASLSVSTQSEIEGNGSPTQPLGLADGPSGADKVYGWNGTTEAWQLFDADFSGGSVGDNWGTQSVTSDATLTGDGAASATALSVNWGAANDLDASGNISDFGDADDLDSDGDLLPNVVGAAELADGTSSGQMWQWNGSAWVFVDGTALGEDNQNISGSGLSGTTLTIGIEDGTNETVNLSSLVNDADYVIGNEFQDLSSSRSGSSVTIAITDGTNATFTDQVNDADADATNEYNTAVDLSGTTLQITDGGGTLTQDLSSLTDGTGTDDQNLTSATLSAANILQVNIEDGSSASVDLSALDDDTDADYIIGNEFQDLSSSRSGSSVTIAITDGTNATFTDQVNDADYVIGNEDVTGLSFNTSDGVLSLTQDHGGTITTDLDGRYMLSGGSDADWQIGAGTVYNTTANIGVGTSSPGAKLEIYQGMSDYGSAFTSPHLNLGTSNTVDATGFVGITYDASTSANYGWSSGALRSGSGQSSFVWKYHNSSAAGVERMRIDQAGNVGIGTTSPSNLFQVNGQASYTATSNMGTNPEDFAHKQYVDNAVSSATDDDWQEGSGTVYNTTDDIGIGTSSPSYLMEIDKTIRTDNVADYGVWMTMRHTSNDDNGTAFNVDIPSWGDGHVGGYHAATSIDDPHSVNANVDFTGLYVTDFSSGGDAFGAYGRVTNIAELSDASAAGVYGYASASSPTIIASSSEVMAGVRAVIGGTINESSGNFHSAALYAEDNAGGTGDHWAGYFDGDVNIDGNLTVSGGLPSDDDWQEGTGTVYNNTDNIGIGTTSPSSALDIREHIDSGNMLYLGDDNNSTGENAHHAIHVQTQGTQQAYIATNGDANFTGQLTAHYGDFTQNRDGVLRLARGSGNATIIPYGSETWMIVDGNPNLGLNYYSSGNVMMAIGGGNVGIGTTSPNEKLDVHGHIEMNAGPWSAVQANRSLGFVIDPENVNTGMEFQWFNHTILSSDRIMRLYEDGDLCPGQDATSDLGRSGTDEWRNLYIDGTATIDALNMDGNIDMDEFELFAFDYLNGSSTTGSTGYGIRDNAGTIEYKNSGGAWSAFPPAPPTGEATEWWVRPTGADYIKPFTNDNARIYDAGQDVAYYYEGSNEKGSFFAGGDVGVVGQRSGVPYSDVPDFTYDQYPFVDTGDDGDIDAADAVTYSGIYGYGDAYNGVTGIGRLDCGVRGIGIYNTGGTNSSWPVVGVMGEVIDGGGSSYGQQGMYGWQAAAAGTEDYCAGVLGRTSQSGAQSGGVVGYYTSSVGNLTTCFTATNYGMIGTADYGGEFFGGIKVNPQSTATAQEGAIYYDSDDNLLKYHNGVGWTSVSGGSVKWTDHGTYLSPAGGEDVYSDGEFYTPSANAVFHHGITGLKGSALGWTPDHADGDGGVWLEHGSGEGGGFYADGNVAAIWSPGDGGLLEVYDEDMLTSGPEFTIDGSGNILPGDNDDVHNIGSTTYEWHDLYVDGTAHLDAIELGGVTHTSWPSGADNLGNHSATMDLDLNSNDILDVGYITTGSTVSTYPRIWMGPSWMDLQVNTSYPFLEISDTYVRSEGGYSYLLQGSYDAANYFIRGDAAGNTNVRTDLTVGSGITLGGVRRTTWPTAAADNMGNHIATRNLDMTGYDISISSGDMIQIASDKNIEFDDANPLWFGYTYGGVTRFYGDAVAAGSKLEAGGLLLYNDLDVDGTAHFDAIDLNGTTRTTWPTGDITGVAAGRDIDVSSGTSGTATVSLETTLDDIVRIDMTGTNSYDKLRVWSSGSYAIGMYTAQTFGYLNDYAMTFTMNNDTDRGFLWRDDGDLASDGAMSLTTDGRLTVKTRVRAPIIEDYNSSSYYWDGSGTTRQNVLYNYGTLYVGSSSSSSSDLYICDRIYDWDATSYSIDMNGTSYFNYLDANRIYLPDASTYMVEGAGNSVRVQTASGYVDIGPQNTTWSHFTTDRPSFYFNKEIVPDGNCRPYTTNTRDLGTSTNQWRYLYVDGTAYLDAIELGGVTNTSWPSGGSSQWTDGGTYKYVNGNSSVRAYEASQSYGMYISNSYTSYALYARNSSSSGGDPGVYGYQGTSTDGTSYSHTGMMCGVVGRVLYGDPYHFGVYGNRDDDTNRSGGVFGAEDDYSPTDWGSLGYRTSSASKYGGYFYGGYTGGLGLLRATPGSGLDDDDHLSSAIGAWGDLFGADIHAEVYGLYAEGGRYASYDHGDRYVDGLDIHLQDTGEDEMSVMYTNVSPNASISFCGTGRLIGGRGEVRFDENISRLLSDERQVIVTVTPIGECEGIHLISSDKNGFVVAENRSGTSDLEFTWSAMGQRLGKEEPILAGEVVSADYTSKLAAALTPDGDLSAPDGTGLYYRDGQLYNEVHPSLLPNEEKIALKERLVSEPDAMSYDEWNQAFLDVDPEDGGISLSEDDFNAMVEDLKLEKNGPVNLYFDAFGNQIPPEWVEELKTEGVQMFTYEEMMERRKQKYIDDARARRSITSNEIIEK